MKGKTIENNKQNPYNKDRGNRGPAFDHAGNKGDPAQLSSGKGHPFGR